MSILKKIKLLKYAIDIQAYTAKKYLIEAPNAAYKCMKTFNNTDTHYFIICDHIGDFLISMGYLKAYRKRNNLNHVTVCVTKKFIGLLNAYKDSWDAYKIVNKKDLYKIQTLEETVFGIRTLNKLGNITIVNPGSAFVKENFEYIKAFPNVSFSDCIKYGNLKLSEDDEFSSPNISTVINESADIMHKEKIAIICPEARFMRLEQSEELYEQICNILLKHDYKVFTNTVDDGKVLKGTTKFTGGFNDFCSLVRNNGIVIGARSGLLDLAAYLDCKIIAIYPNSNYYNFFDLNALPGKKSNGIVQFLEYDDKLIYKISGIINSREICKNES